LKQRTASSNLTAVGKRVTAQRTLLFELIRQSNVHLDAEELYRRAKKKQPRLSLSTVYRTLQMLKEAGLVEEHHFDEAHHHYEAKSPSEHHHLVCLDCGKIIEFACPQTGRIKRNVGSDYGFDILHAEVRLEGICSDCRKGR
jgi:Fur family ferric uptake transcriptional regulator